MICLHIQKFLLVHINITGISKRKQLQTIGVSFSSKMLATTNADKS